MKFAFFGTPQISETILDHLEGCGFLPSLVVCAPDKPKGRGMTLTPPETKVWAQSRNIPVLQPQKFDDDFYFELLASNFELFIFAAYGKIIPQKFLDLPKKGSVNIHPSLLPKYRGPSPIQSQILNNDNEIGTTIMLMDAQMDHGPIIAQKKVSPPDGKEFPLSFTELINLLAHESGKLLCEALPKYLSEEITPVSQNHEEATLCKMIEKEDGLLDIENGEPYKNYLKFLALNPWPGTYFFIDKGNKKIRVKITDAEFSDGHFVIMKIIPEGKHEMSFDDFNRNL